MGRRPIRQALASVCLRRQQGQTPHARGKTAPALLDVEGPGVVTLIHVSKYGGGDQDKLILRIWCDGGLSAMLRCRGTDKVSFATSCRWVVNYQNEFFSRPELTTQPRLHDRASFPMPYRSAVYYYSKAPF